MFKGKKQKAKELKDSGDIELDNGQYNAAILHYSVAIKCWPDYAEAHLQRGIAAYYRSLESNNPEDYYTISRYFNDAMAHDLSLQQQSTAWYYLGLNALHHNRTEIAISHYFSASLKLSPLNYKIHIDMGNTYFKLGQYQDARDEYNAFIKLQAKLVNKLIEHRVITKEAAEVLNQQATAYMKSGLTSLQLSNYDKALESLDKAINLNPNDVSACINMGKALFFLKRYEEAIEFLQRALEIEPDNAWIHADMGDVLLSWQQGDRAAVYFDNAAELFIRIGRYAEALEYYQRVLELHPDNITTMIGIRDALFNLGQHPEGLDINERINNSQVMADSLPTYEENEEMKQDEDSVSIVSEGQNIPLPDYLYINGNVTSCVPEVVNLNLDNLEEEKGGGYMPDKFLDNKYNNTQKEHSQAEQEEEKDGWLGDEPSDSSNTPITAEFDQGISSEAMEDDESNNQPNREYPNANFHNAFNIDNYLEPDVIAQRIAGYRHVIKYYTTILTSNPRDNVALKIIADAYAQIGHNYGREEARQNYAQALDYYVRLSCVEHHQNPDTFSHIGDIRTLLKDYDGAEWAYNKFRILTHYNGDANHIGDNLGDIIDLQPTVNLTVATIELLGQEEAASQQDL